MIVVLDASAAIELVLKRPASLTIQEALDEADFILVPDLYIAEVSNAVWKIASAAGNEIRPSDILDDAVALPDEFVSSRDLYREAYAFSIQKRHPVYDSLYAITARRNGATLLTMDRRLASIAASENIAVIPST